MPLPQVYQFCIEAAEASDIQRLQNAGHELQSGSSEGSYESSDGQSQPGNTAGKYPRLTVPAPTPSRPECGPDEIVFLVSNSDSSTGSYFVVPKLELCAESKQFAALVADNENDRADGGSSEIHLHYTNPEHFAVLQEYLVNCKKKISHLNLTPLSSMKTTRQLCGLCRTATLDVPDELFIAHLYSFSVRYSINDEFDDRAYHSGFETYRSSCTFPSSRTLSAAKCSLKANSPFYLMLLAFCLDALVAGSLDLQDLMQQYDEEVVQDLMIWDRRLREQNDYEGEGEEAMYWVMCRMNCIFRTVTWCMNGAREAGCEH